MLFAVCGLSCIDVCFVVFRLLVVGSCLLFVVCCLLTGVCCLLSVACCLKICVLGLVSDLCYCVFVVH